MWCQSNMELAGHERLSETEPPMPSSADDFRSDLDSYLRDVAQHDDSLAAELTDAELSQAVDDASARLGPLWAERGPAPPPQPPPPALRRSSGWAAIAVALPLTAAMGSLVVAVVSDIPRLEFVGAAGAALLAIVALMTRMLTRTEEQLEEVAEQAIETAQQERRTTFRRQVALPELRAAIDRIRSVDFSTVRGQLQADGLRELVDPSLDVDLDAQRELSRLLTELRSGSIGVAGFRGAGKTTLLQAAASGRLAAPGRSSALGLSVSAPVSYDPREFLTHLFAQLCLTVLGDRVLDRHYEEARDARRRASLGGLGATLGLVGVLFGAYAAVAGQRSATALSGFLIAAGVAFLSAVVLGILFPFRLSRQAEASRDGDPRAVQDAWSELAKLRYLETTTHELSTELRISQLRFGGRRGVSHASQASTTPELVDRYMQLLTTVAEESSVVITIDELDKMASTAEVERFLNGIKSILGQRGVFYLVSVSDDALRAFEQRGLPIRDAFESVFDEVMTVEPLSLGGATAILRRRVLGLPAPFAALCHVVAGGLPRELIRCAREIAFEYEQDALLSTVARGLLERRGTRREQAAEILARRSVGPDGCQPLLTWLRGLEPVRSPVDAHARTEIRPVLEELGALRAGGADAATVDALSLSALELAAGWYHGATVMEFFGGLDEPSFVAACSEEGGRPAAIELLALATLDLGAAPALAWQTVNRFRETVGLPPRDYPQADLLVGS